MKKTVFSIKKLTVLALLTFNFMNFTPSTALAQVSLEWVKQLKGANNEVGNSIAVDASGNVYTIGYFAGTTDFDPGPNTFNLTTAGWDDVFVTKFDASGNFVWAKQFSGTNDDYGQSIAVDASGNVYTTGFFMGTVDFDPGTGVSNLISAGNDDIFVVKLTSSGTLSWAKRIGGTLKDDAYSLKVDGSSNVILTGTFAGTVDFDPGTGTSNLVSVGSQDIFILKLSSSGNYVWAKSIGSMTSDCGWAVTVDGTGNVFATGSYTGTADFDPGNTTTFNMTASANKDIFILKLDASGNFGWAKSIGGDNDEEGYSIAVDGSNVYTTGYFNGTVNFGTGANLTSQGYDIFVSKLSSNGTFVWAKKTGGSIADYGKYIAVDTSGNVYTTGYFNGTVDFDPGAGTYNLISKGGADIFISKLNSSGNFVFARQFGGTSGDQGYFLTVNSSNNLYMTGFFSNTVDFDPGSSTVNLISGGLYDVFVLKLNVSTGIEIIDNSFGIFIFPNPSDGHIIIKQNNALYKKYFLSVRNVQGQELISEKIICNKTSSLDLTNLADGIYFLNITTDKESFIKKIIIQH